MANFDLEAFFGQPARLILPGDPALAQMAGLPPVWQAALSVPSLAGDAVYDLWEPVYPRARGFVTWLATRTQGLALVVSPQGSFTPKLFYEAGGPRYGWLAGPPAGEEQLRLTSARLGWSLPASYRTFLQIHDGLRQVGGNAGAFSSLEGLEVLPARPEAARGLLPFYRDGSGAWQAFDLGVPTGRGDYQTLSFHPAGGPARPPQSFWSFLKEFTVRTP